MSKPLVTKRNPTNSPPGEHSRVHTHDARKDWGDLAPFLDLPPWRSSASAPFAVQL
jgi:hypothetical protein